MKNLYLIAAIGKNNELGFQNDLIWKISEDLNFFKEKTMGCYVIMGKNTHESLPRKLKDRKYVVITNEEIACDEETKLFYTIDDVLNYVKKNPDDIFYVIGGGMVYKQFLPYVSTMYLTEIDDTFEKADVYFSNFDKNEWNIEEKENLEENRLKYSHVKYVRKV